MTEKRRFIPKRVTSENWLQRAWTGKTGGNKWPNKVFITWESQPGRYTVTREQYERGERP